MSPDVSLEALPTWARFNDVDFCGTQVRHVELKGFGLFTDHPRGENHESRTLLKIPRDLILSAEAVDNYAKVDQNFRQLLDKVGHQVCLSVPVVE